MWCSILSYFTVFWTSKKKRHLYKGNRQTVLKKKVNKIKYSLELSLKHVKIIYLYLETNHHHHVVPLARISLTLSRHFSLSFIASGRSSGLHPVSSLTCCMYVRAGCSAFAQPYVGVHRSTSLMSWSLLLQQCPACLVNFRIFGKNKK